MIFPFTLTLINIIPFPYNVLYHYFCFLLAKYPVMAEKSFLLPPSQPAGESCYICLCLLSYPSCYIPNTSKMSLSSILRSLFFPAFLNKLSSFFSMDFFTNSILSISRSSKTASGSYPVWLRFHKAPLPRAYTSMPSPDSCSQNESPWETETNHTPSS